MAATAMPGPATLHVPALGPGECQVWWARLDCCAPRHRWLLNPAERQRYERYLRDRDRDRFTLGVALSRLILGAHLKTSAADVPIDRTCERCGESHGRPRVTAGAALDYSVSHSGELVAVAVARSSGDGSGPARSVGVDVERVAPLTEPAVPGLVLSAAERAAFGRLSPADQPAAFFRYWVRKEAVLKATGEGLSVPLAQLTVSGFDQPPQLREWPERRCSGPVTMHDLGAAAGYAASLAVIGRGVAVTERDATAVLAGRD